MCGLVSVSVPFYVYMFRCLCVYPCLGGRLNVQGRRAMMIRSSSAELDEAPGTSSGPSSHDKQRVIEVEGLMEEYLAFDSRDL